MRFCRYKERHLLNSPPRTKVKEYPVLLSTLRRSIIYIGLSSGLLLSTQSSAEITITEMATHQFPDVVASSKTGKLRLTWNNSVKSVKNTQVVGDYHNVGEFLIESDTDNTISVNIENVGDVKGVKLKTFQFRYKGKTYTRFPATGLPNPGNSGKIAKVGMRILFRKSVKPGDVAPSYELTITEETPLPTP